MTNGTPSKKQTTGTTPAGPAPPVRQDAPLRKGTPMMNLYAWYLTLETRLKEDRGATAVEYGLLIAGIAALIIATVFLIGPQLNTMFNGVLTKLKGTA